MATTARRRDPDDDIAAIAKQISDQAEAIYQNWKSRGLAPADLINCHAAGDASRLDSMLKPQSASKPSIELLAQAPTMDNNRLEKLVKNFVVEDKARLAAKKNMASSIQYALQKFEKSSQPETGFVKRIPSKTNASSHTAVTATPVQKTRQPRPAVGAKPQILTPKPRLLSDTVEITLPADLPGTGLQTWPLKNKVITTDAVKKTTAAEVKAGALPNYNTLPSKTPTAASSSYVDEVAREEKRLINALKNGVVLAEETAVAKTAPTPPPATAAAAATSSPPSSAKPQPQPAQKEPERDGATRWGPRNIKRPDQQVPHPELTTSQRQHIRQTAANPVRPFLTKGSVAERVLIFERCPSDLLLDKRVRAPVVQTPKPQLPAKQHQTPQHHTTLQRHVRAHRNVHIPRFHFPAGKPTAPAQLEALRANIVAAFAAIGERATREHFSQLTAACQLPLYWKTPLCLAACADKGSCSQDQFLAFWTSMTGACNDAASRFVHILTRGRRCWLAPEDFIPMVQDVVETHPGLTFLKEATEFHSRYVHTVIARIFYCVNRSWSGRITVPELRRSNLLGVVQLLEEEEDINQITAYFSYEHFYVIYCKFWELDQDHDLYIDKQDLARHSDHALSTRIIDRIFSGCVTKGQRKAANEEKMSYTEFVWFLLSEEDKSHPTAIEYWFRCMDVDGDGYLSMYELEHFYEEQMHRIESLGIETLPYQDCLCQMLDMIKPKVPGRVSLADLKRCKMTPIFFDTFFNLEKYLDHEQRDPFASQRDHDADGQEMSDWDRYAAEEYELLVAEEGNDNQDSLSYDEGNDEDLLSQALDAPCSLSDDSDECSI